MLILIEIILAILAAVFFYVGLDKKENNINFLISILCLGFIGLIEAIKTYGG